MKFIRVNCIAVLLILGSTFTYASRLIPAAPELTPVTNRVYVGHNGVQDHSDTNNPLSIQYFLDQAISGDEIVLSHNKTYEISNQLSIPSGVRLRGKYRDGAQWGRQKVAVLPNFPQDLAMVLLESDSVLEGIDFDGRNIAWRILRLSDNGSDYLVTKNTFANTKHDFNEPPEDGWRGRVGGSNYHVDLIYVQNSSRIKITDNILMYGGLKNKIGRINQPGTWAAIGAGITAYSCSDMIIENNHIRGTITAGISISGSQIVSIEANKIEYTGRNVEWWTVSNNHPLGDGITGYHNHSFQSSIYHGQPLNWLIKNNEIYHSGNHGIHVGGNGITIIGNNVRYTNQSGLFLGDWRDTNGGKECLFDVVIDGLRIRDTGHIQFLYNENAEIPSYFDGNILLRSYSNNESTIIFTDIDLDQGRYYDDSNSGCVI